MSYANYSRLFKNCNGSQGAKTSSDRYLLPSFPGYYVSSLTMIPDDMTKQGIIYQETSLPNNVEYRYENLLEGYRHIPSKIEKKCPKEQEVSTCGLDSEGHSICGSGNLYAIMDPRFNLRECAKNMILLEDHLFQKGKRCKDCILKHLLTIEGFLEEAVTLDKDGSHLDEIQDAIDNFRDLFKQISVKIKDGSLTDEDCCDLAQNIRKMRKPLCQSYATFV